MIKQEHEQLDVQRIYEIFQINEDVKSYFDQEIDQSMLSGLPQQNILNIKEEEHKSSIFAITKTQIIEVTSVVQVLRDLGSVQDRISQGSMRRHGSDGRPLETEVYDNLVHQQEDEIKQIGKKKNQLLISNAFKIINIVNIEITGDEQSLLVIKFLNKQSTDSTADSDFTRTPNEAVGPRMQQALNVKQSIASPAIIEKHNTIQEHNSVGRSKEGSGASHQGPSSAQAQQQRGSMYKPITYN